MKLHSIPTFCFLVSLLPFCYGSGGELRKRIVNYCDTSIYNVRIEAFDWINNYERFTYFEFIDHVRGPTGNNGLTIPISYFDDSVINDANTVYFPHTYRSTTDGVLPEIVITRVSNGEELPRAPVNDDDEALYITCDNDDARVSADVTSFSIDDDFSYRINDASCSGGIRVFGRSRRFYGE